MAEERARGAAEGEWRRLEDPDYVWEGFRPRAGDIVEFETGLVEGHLHSGHYGAYLVTSTRETGEGSLELNGRCVGCNHEEAGKTLSSLLNRKQQPLHLCHSMPCTYEDMEGLVHVIAARWFNCATFEASYMKPWGKLVIKEYLQADETEGTEAPGGRRRSALKRPAGAATPRRAGPRTAGKTAGLDGAKLRDKLRRLRGRGAGEDAKKGDEVITVEESEVSEYLDNSDSAEEDGSPELSGGAVVAPDITGDQRQGEERAEGTCRRRRQEEEEEEEVKGETKRQGPGASAAGASRAGEASPEGGDVWEGFRKEKRLHLRKGKGVGEGPAWREEVERKEEEEKWSSSLGPWRGPGLTGGELGGVGQGRGCKRVQLVRNAGSPPTKVFKEARHCVEASDSARKACAGSNFSGGDERGLGHHMWSQDDFIFQPDDQAISSQQQPDEGAQPPLGVPGRVAGRGVGEAGRLPCFPLPGPAHGGERGHVESGPIPGASSSRSYPGSPCLSPPGGTKTREAGEQSTGRRGVASTSPRRRPMAGERKRRWQQRKRAEEKARIGPGRAKEKGAGREETAGARAPEEEIGGPAKRRSREQRCEAGREGSQEVRSLEDETPEGSCPVTCSLKGDKGLGFFRLCCDEGRSLRQLGVMMAWLVSQGAPVDGAGRMLTPLSCILPPMVFSRCWPRCRASHPQKGRIAASTRRPGGPDCAAERLHVPGHPSPKFFLAA